MSDKPYTLLLRNGHVIDPANGRDGTHDVALAGDRVARIAPAGTLSDGDAEKCLDASGLYVTPGLLDIHVHYFDGCGRLGIHPDFNAFPSGVTTALDVGTAGWRNFEEFRRRIIDSPRIKCRVLALVNIVATGMELPQAEQDADEMQPEPTAEMAKKHADVVVGIKTAHYMQPGWAAVDRTVAAAERAGMLAMFDFAPRPERSYEDLLLKKARPGDFHTHPYARHIPSLDERGRVHGFIWEARQRGVKFDLGHGGGSFWYRLAAPNIEQGNVADTISTDQHQGSVNGPVFDQATTMSKLLCLGLALPDVIRRSTSLPAELIGRPELGRLDEGGEADLALLRLSRGQFGYWDCGRGRMVGDRRLECQLTVRAGQVVYDREGLTMPDWRTLGPSY
jgi:dihydroorotase